MARDASRTWTTQLLVPAILACFAPVLWAATPLPAQSSTSGLWFVCSWRTTGSDGLTYFISDVIAPGPGSEPTTLVPAFINYVSVKYGLSNAAKASGLADCIYKFSDADARTLLTQFANRPPSGSKPLLTGWKYGMQAPGGGVSPSANAAKASGSTTAATATVAARSGAPAAAAASAPMAAAVAQQPPVEATVVVRLVDNVNSTNAPAGKQYRAVVTEPVTAASVKIPRDAIAKLTLEPTADGFSTQLVSLTIDGQPTPVTSTSVTATSGIEAAAKKVGGFINGLAKGDGANKAADAVNAAGRHVALPPGTQLRFSTMIPQPAPGEATTAVASPAAAAPAAGAGRATAASSASTAGQAGGNRAAIAMCGTTTTDGKLYVSGIFDAGKFDAMAYQNMNANWHPGEMAFQNYLRSNLNKQIGNGGCIIYPSVARAQQVLDIWKQEQEKKGGTPYIVETGWMYTAAEAAAPRRGGIGK